MHPYQKPDEQEEVRHGKQTGRDIPLADQRWPTDMEYPNLEITLKTVKPQQAASSQASPQTAQL